MARSSRSGALQRGIRLGCVAVLFALSCSSEGGGGNVAGTGGRDAGAGTSGSGGVSGDAGVSAPGNDAGGTFSTLDFELQTRACKDYVAAWCDRHTECEIWDAAGQESCMAAQQQCPDRFFAQGAGYTIDSLNACGEVWHTFSCESLAAGELPDCIQHGTLPKNESCRFTTQCASGICTTPNGDEACGVCLEAGESGGECVIDRQCPEGLMCRFGRCLQFSSWSPEDSLSDGEPCTYDGRCLGLCAPTEAGPRCVPAPLTGAPCIAEPPEPGARRCLRTDYCSEDGLCLALPGPDAACVAGLRPCAGGNYCDSSDGVAPGTCRAWIEPGDTCDPAIHDANFACRERTTCRCIDASCSSALCAYANGDTHGCENGEACAAGTECRAGMCRMLFRDDQCGGS